MVVKRYRSKRKRPYQSKRRRFNIARPMRYRMPVGVTKIQRTFNSSYWQPSAASTVDFWKQFQFTLDQMPSYTELTPLFDQYKINAIKVRFVPRFDSFAGNDTTDITPPNITNLAGTQLHIIKDQRTTMAPAGTYTRANLNTFLENGKVRSYTGNRPITVYFKPAVTQTVGNAQSSFTWSPWLQTSQPAIVHYGFHAFASDINMSGNFGNSWDVFTTYYLMVKGLR
ncbi:hypothetical protein [Candidatus Magnetobacterium casense]|uniref:Capsid protein n=1 Tax=Candidatus Magnetobacterium casense TaxID=1455061 RepID=A0ABS6S3F9_9BACT|nr:hypothetical protein [Candidatus Magnetobacterium casensis]MBV6343385.1 hypothetical protein [Candidatus Magnetobacterium casensis]